MPWISLKDHHMKLLLREIIKETIHASGTESIQDMGRVMGILMNKLADSADGKLVQQIVREELS